MFRKGIACMGTGFTFQIVDPVSELELVRLVDDAAEILEDANQRFSLYIESSEISQLVRGDLAWENASPQQLEIRKQCESWKSVTGGFFDARSHAQYDPSGLVKTWATQNAANFLQANGLRQFTINAGGDVLLSDDLSDSVLQRVGISNLAKRGTEAAGVNFVLDLAGSHYRAVATSGSAERGEHIWRKTESTVVQATVIGVDLVTTDIWATALVSGGLEAWRHFETQPNLTGIMVFGDGSVRASSGFSALLAAL